MLILHLHSLVKKQINCAPLSGLSTTFATIFCVTQEFTLITKAVNFPLWSLKISILFSGYVEEICEKRQQFL